MTSPARDQPAPGLPPRRVVPAEHPLFTRSSGVLVRAGDRGVDTDIPGDLPGRVRERLQPSQDRRPDPGPLPTTKQPVDRLPRPIDRRHITPGRASTHPPPDPVDKLPSAPPRRATWPLPDRQQRFQYRPLRVSQVKPPRHHYAGHEVSGVLIVLVDDRSTGDLTYLINDTPTQPPPKQTSRSQLRDTA